MMKTSAATVASLFASPPSWLTKQIVEYRKDPDRHIQPLCTAVAAEVLGDATRGPEISDEVERALEDRG
jgi:hypothetical protein